MSESRNNSESRGRGYISSYVSSSSESRDLKESRCDYSINSFSSESRESRYNPSYVSSPSESRDLKESRCGYSINSFSSENKKENMDKSDSKGQANNTRYNNLEDVDSLIEKLEGEGTITSDNPIVNEALKQRIQKIEELKRLREAAKRAIEAEKQLKMLEKSNKELDAAISSVKNLVIKHTISSNESSY